MSETQATKLAAVADSQFDPHAYTVVIRRVNLEDKPVFHGRVIELPDLEAFEPTHQAAYDFLIDGIESAKEAFDEQGRPFPAPLPDEIPEYSGRVTIRMPKWLHQQLGFSAQIDGTSLNQYMVSILAFAMTPGWNSALHQDLMIYPANSPFQEISTFGIGNAGIGAIGAHMVGVTSTAYQRIQNVSHQSSGPVIRVATSRPEFREWHSNVSAKPPKLVAGKKA